MFAPASRLLAPILAIPILATAFVAAAPAMARADEVVKVVYHLPDEQNATLAMHNIANHLAADPDAKIVVVALARGVKSFVFGAQDATGKPYADWVDQLAAKGVEFRICQNSMTAFKLAKGDLVDKVQVVPSGVAEIGRLQAKEGFAYIRP